MQELDSHKWDADFSNSVSALSQDEQRVEFPEAYKEDFPPAQGAEDLKALNSLADGALSFAVYEPIAEDHADLRLKIFSDNNDLVLSKLLPHLTLLGVDVLDERPYELELRDKVAMIYDFGLRLPGGKESIATDWTEADRKRFTEAFEASYKGTCEADTMNALVTVAKLSWAEVEWLRAIARYLQQAGVSYTQLYIQQTLVDNPELAAQIAKIFRTKFDPAAGIEAEAHKAALEAEYATFMDMLEKVESLDHDRIFRLFLTILKAAIRTNAFQADREALAIKMLPREIDFLPKPRPMFEIFVYSPRVEGVHLRYGMVARGGLRWSDRRDDFRTEILGLVKAQMVKNTVIVPVGAKGGFFPKQLPSPAVDRAAWQAEGVACYKIFIGSLLTVTDNIVDGKVVPAKDVVRYDSDDPYLVVAADKGTATFSDIANGISLERNHWLGDAFASGGSIGYDHKGMGITARGAWESVKRHFKELGVDCQNEDFTCVGIGDMGGDVFGNGMMLSQHTRLLAAFNHMHIFIDPNPDAKTSFDERVRMFNARQGWDGYNTDLISEGGGVYLRSAKSIKITPQAREALGLPEGVNEMAPVDLIHEILKAPVDLLWNGGIGTYVKGSSETNAQVGDKANDVTRVNGNEIRAKIIGEGGNLGCTQLGRIEYALNGGKINTDFIDNSAGVDTSDNEVNIKILYAQVIADGKLTMEERNAELPQMTEDVAKAVLAHNIEQNKALQAANVHVERFAGVHEDWMTELEQSGYLDRKVQFMPSTAEMQQRIKEGRGLTNPELCTLLAWTKIKLEDDVLASDLPDDPYLADRLVQYFPPLMREKYADAIPHHRLHREIITTVAVNRFVDSQGITAFHRLSSETGAPVADIMRAQLASRAIYNAGLTETLINNSTTLDAATATELRMELRKVVERATGWMLHHRRMPLDIKATNEEFTEGVTYFKEHIRELLEGRLAEEYDRKLADYTARGVDEKIAKVIAAAGVLPLALPIVEMAKQTDKEIPVVAKVYFAMGEKLGLDMMFDRVLQLPRITRWESMSRGALRDDLLSVHAQLTGDALKDAVSSDPKEIVDVWATKTGGVDSKAATLAEITKDDADLARLSVGMRIVRSMLAK